MRKLSKQPSKKQLRKEKRQRQLMRRKIRMEEEQFRKTVVEDMLDGLDGDFEEMKFQRQLDQIATDV